MPEMLPLELDYDKVAHRGAFVSGLISRDKISRNEGLFSLRTDVSANLAFEKVESDDIMLVCNVSAVALIDCQRCLETFEFKLNKSSEFVVREQNDDQLLKSMDSDGRDIFFANNGKLDVLELIEDELLLAVPMIPRHEEFHLCGFIEHSPEADEAREVRKPFAKLREMIADSGDNN